MMFRLYRDCTPSHAIEYAIGEDYRTGVLVGAFSSETAAMRAAQDMGLLRRAGSDEGGATCAVLDNRHMIVKSGWHAA